MCPHAPGVPSSRYHPSHPSIRGFIPLPLTASLPYQYLLPFVLPCIPANAFTTPHPTSPKAPTCYHSPCIPVIQSTHLHASSRTHKSKQISSMETPTPCGPSGADANQYLAITIHILVAVGFSYLLRLLYQLVSWLLFSRRRSPDERDGESPSPSLTQPLDSLSECKDLKLTMLVSFNSNSRRKHRH